MQRNFETVPLQPHAILLVLVLLQKRNHSTMRR